jgi:hypothetical protein
MEIVRGTRQNQASRDNSGFGKMRMLKIPEATERKDFCQKLRFAKNLRGECTTKDCRTGLRQLHSMGS